MGLLRNTARVAVSGGSALSAGPDVYNGYRAFQAGDKGGAIKSGILALAKCLIAWNVGNRYVRDRVEETNKKYGVAS